MPLYVDGVEITEMYVDGVQQIECWVDGVQVFVTGAYSIRSDLLVSTPNGSDVPVTGDRFGWSYVTDGTTIVIGAPYRDSGANGTTTNEGYVYVFEKVGGVWTQVQRLQASDFVVASGDLFGYGVAVEGNTIIVSSPQNTTGFGKLYVFEKQGSPLTWVEVQTMTASDALADDLLGRSLSLSGDILVAGADVSDTVAYQSGAAYVFERVGGLWPSTETQKLLASDAAASEWFGSTVKTDGTTMVIGAGYSDAGAVDAGALYVFEHNGTSWVELQKMVHSTPVTDGRIGITIEIEGTTIYASAWRDDNSGLIAPGAVLFFEKTTVWPSSETGKITSTDSIAGDGFGIRFGISGTTMVVAGGILNNNNDGKLTFFEKTGSPLTWTETGRQILPPDVADNANFASIHMAQNILLAAISTHVNESGIVYVYDN